MQQTICACRKCGKEIKDRWTRMAMEKFDDHYCPSCRYLENIGVVTSKQYNVWLRGGTLQEIRDAREEASE